jgi:hypothetical protein
MSTQFVTLREASRLTGRNTFFVMKLAATREIEVELKPGHNLRFSRDDCERIARRPEGNRHATT